MRVLILGEGPTDLGRSDPDGTVQLEGTVPIIVRRLLEGGRHKAIPVDIRIQSIKKPRLFGGPARRIGHSRYGYANRLVALLGLKEGREADAIVAVVDRDGERYKDKKDELNKGRDTLLAERKPCAVGLAVEEIEAWLLADEKALCTACQSNPIQRQPNPEDLTSRDDKSDKNPKGRLHRIMETALGRPIMVGEFPNLYAAIARAADMQAIEIRCPLGFKPFADQVRELLMAVESNTGANGPVE